MPNPPDIPAPLARFPAEVRDAYVRFAAERDEAALSVVILAAVHDFMPRSGAQPRAEPPRAEERLIEDLGFDSLAIAETVFFFEDLFRVTIKNEELFALHTVGELCGFVVSRLRTNLPSA